MVRVAVLDDYQDVALKMADWRVLPSDMQVQVFRDHLADQQDVAQRLRSFEVVLAHRAFLSATPTGVITAPRG